jgi:beta-fructofuranosidase
MWAWIFDHPAFAMRTEFGWSGTMSLPRVLSLGDDGTLRMDVPAEVERLRYNERSQDDLVVAADGQVPLDGIGGASLELVLELSSVKAAQFGIKVCCAPGGEEETLVYYDTTDQKLKIDTNKSSLEQGAKTIEGGPLKLTPGEPLRLRVFVDKSVVEVFANGRQAVMRRVYPSLPKSTGVALFSRGGETQVKGLKAWDLMPSNPY